MDSQQFLDKAYRFLSFRPRSVREITYFLKKKKTPPSLIDQVLSQLKKQKLVDDLAFAQWWVEQRSTFRPKGRRALQVELRQKGIDRQTVEEALKDLDELSLAQKALAKKTGDQKQLTSFLARRGFSWPAIKQTLDKKLKKE